MLNNNVCYRARHIDNWEYVEGYYLDIRDMAYILPICGELCDLVRVDPSTVLKITNI